MAMNDSSTLLFAAIPGAFVTFNALEVPRGAAQKRSQSAKPKKSCGQCTLCTCKRSKDQ
jgi:hypothetical protein